MEDTKVVDYTARAKRAWETRRANAKKFESKRPRGRPKKIQTPPKVVAVETQKPVDVQKPVDKPTGLLLSSVVYSYEQIKELNVAAVTTDGKNYRLLFRNGKLIPTSVFEKNQLQNEAS